MICIWFVFAGMGALEQGALSQVSATPPTDTAAEVPRFSIFAIGNYPQGFFDLALKPGESARLEAGVRNGGKSHVALRTFAANALSGANGGFVAGKEGDTPIPPTDWLSFPTETFDIDPNETRRLP